MNMKNSKTLCGFLISRRRRCLVTVLVPLVVAACDDASTSDVGVSPVAQQGVLVPDAVRRAAIEAEGTLAANLYCGENSAAISMSISEGVAQGACAGISTAVSHEITVEFEFESVMFPGTYVLARATQVGVTVDPGGTDLSFDSESFIYEIDNDGDGVSNYQELIDGTDPGIPTCVFGRSRIGQCVL